MIKKGYFWLGLFGSLLIAGCAPSGKNVVTLEEYNQLTPNMSYGRTKKIIGSEGTLQKTTYKPWTVEDTKSYVRRIYSWHNADGSSILVMFQDDRLIGRSQEGLEKLTKKK